MISNGPGNQADWAHHFGSIRTTGGSWVGSLQEGEFICGDSGERIEFPGCTVLVPPTSNRFARAGEGD